MTNGTGTMGSENVTDVRVNCVISRFTVSVVVSGLRGINLILRNNDSDTIVVHSNGTYAFPMEIESGQSYNVTVAGGPIFFQQCTPQDGAGLVTDRDVQVQIVCN